MKKLKRILFIYTLVYYAFLMISDKAMTDYKVVFAIAAIPVILFWLYMGQEYRNYHPIAKDEDGPYIWLVGLLRYTFILLATITRVVNIILPFSTRADMQRARKVSIVEWAFIIAALICVAIYTGVKRPWDEDRGF